MIFTTALFSSVMMPFGVPAGASSPAQPTASKPENPACSTVGKSGRALARVKLPTAMAFSLSAFKYGIINGPVSNITEVRPPKRSVTAAGELLYGI